MKFPLCFISFIFLLPLSMLAQSTDSSTTTASMEKPRIFITDSQSWETRAAAGGNGAWGGASTGGARPQTAEIIKTFSERCPSVMVNNLQERADFIVVLDHEGGKGWLQHKNKVAVFERISGDTIVSKSTLSLGGSVQEACDAIAKYWAQNGSRLLSAKAAAQPVASGASAVPVAVKPSPAQISVASTPSGADIEVDGNFVGNTPSSIESVAGDHVVRITKKGFQPYEKKIRVSGGTITLNAELEPTQK